ncbi:T9SS type A sorting domain-containing protein (plasmid) [Chryseobacterium panacisoli]|uniref:T9SS type A sorting domain-containing protein n=1 Tax=Chryseobacterium panacisoli TaxID=1807141 RepID=A0A5D9A077_9FLAO|nr:T9SS type A sorting domain-containing protein [Chryseobacterium panacisoli]TZG00252.1 T9SS type A sorting domain-containing protein [Chryseobacterium panacisoli]
MRHLTFTFLFFTFSISMAQTAPSIEWQKALGGSQAESANAIQQTSDGGYIVAGNSMSSDGNMTNHGDSDYWIIKLDTSGSIQWQKSLGGSFYDSANSIQQTADGGYIVAGESYSIDGDITGNHGNSDYWIVKLDASGTMQWQKSLGGTNEDWANSVQQTSDGGYIVAGESYSTDGDITGNHGNSDYWIVKLDSSGGIQWQKALGGTSYDRANSIQQTFDGGYIVAGGSASNNGDITGNHGNEDFWIVKLNSSGIIQWEKSLVGNLADAAESIRQTSEGGYIVAGGSNSTNSEIPTNFGESNYCVAKLDSNGNTLWQKYFGGSGNDYAYSTQPTSDGGYIVAGATGSANGDIIGSHGSSEYWIIKLDSSGIMQWQKPLGGTSFDEAYSIQQTADGGYILAGQISSTDGEVTGAHGSSDSWIVKLNSDQLSTAENHSINKPSIYPNPSKDFFYVDHLPKETVVSITDMSGRKLFSQQYNEEKIRINTSAFTEGIYMIQIRSKEEIILSKKITVSR